MQELAALQAAWRRVLAGHRQVVFVSGEAGIGKTALLEAFLAAKERHYPPRQVLDDAWSSAQSR